MKGFLSFLMWGCRKGFFSEEPKKLLRDDIFQIFPVWDISYIYLKGDMRKIAECAQDRKLRSVRNHRNILPVQSQGERRRKRVSVSSVYGEWCSLTVSFQSSSWSFPAALATLFSAESKLTYHKSLSKQDTLHFLSLKSLKVPEDFSFARHARAAVVRAWLREEA